MKVYNYYLLYGNIVMSIFPDEKEAERQKQFYIDNKVVRYPELLTVEKMCPFVSLK